MIVLLIFALSGWLLTTAALVKIGAHNRALLERLDRARADSRAAHVVAAAVSEAEPEPPSGEMRPDFTWTPEQDPVY